MADLRALIPRLANQRVLVVGDVILDEYLIGRATRMSREAPIPVLEYESRRLIPGGAANPAANIAALGSTAVQLAVIGADAEAESLRQVLMGAGIDVSGLVIDPARPTTLKTRLMAAMGLRSPQQVARIDKLSREPIPESIKSALCHYAHNGISAINAVLFSDYQGGLLTPSLVDQVREIARVANVLVTADAQGELDKYVGCDLAKCNADEARAYLRRELVSDDDFAQAAVTLRERLDLRVGMVITRGADGATAADAQGAVHLPAPEVTDVYDTVGAGDTAIAVMTLALGAGASLADAVRLANHAGGIVVRRVGNYAPTRDELLAAVEE